jgi:hypothetical protein
MEKLNITEKLNEFITGVIDIENLSDIIDDRLFELRQKPELTEEQELLSNLELYIHEAREGYRSWDEIYGYILSEIKSKMAERFIKTITLNSSSTSEFLTITQAIPVKDYRLSPV